MNDETPRPASRLQRILAYIIAALVVVSLLCIFAIIIGTWLGAGAAQGSGQGVWPTVIMFPTFALPAAFVLIMVLLFVSLVGRSKQNRDSSR